MTNLSHADRKWLCKLAAITVRAIVSAVIARECTVVAIGAAKRIEKFYEHGITEIDNYDNEGYEIREQQP